MIVFIATTGEVKQLPQIEENEELHVIATEGCTFPVTLLAYKNNIQTHLIHGAKMTEKDSQVNYLFMLGCITAHTNGKVIVYCATEAIRNIISTIKADNVEIEARLVTDRVRKSRTKAEVEKPSAKTVSFVPDKAVVQLKPESKRVKPANIKELLNKQGIPEEIHDIVTKAVGASSDEEIGLDIQLRMMLATTEKSYSVIELIKKIKPVYKQLKKLVE